MAIVKMQKLSICAPRKNRKAVLEQLQSLGVMEIREEELPHEGLEFMDTQSQKMQFEKSADTLDTALKLLKQYAPGKSGGGLFGEKEVVPRRKYDDECSQASATLADAQDVLKQAKQINETEAQILRDQSTIAALTPWKPLDIPMNTSGTRRTQAAVGTFPGTMTDAEIIAAVSANLGDPAPVDVTFVGRDNGLVYTAVLYLKSDQAAVEENLREAGFARPAVGVAGVPAQVISDTEANIRRGQDYIEGLRKIITQHAKRREDFKVTADYYRTRAVKYELLGKIPQSKSMFFLEGWVEAAKADAIADMLTQRYGALVEREERREDELPPTLLHNNRFSTPAESVLESYGLPQYGRVDPTFIMSIFYVFFFGMMLSDAGYGIVMTVLCAVVLAKHRRLESGIKRMLQLFFWCGLSTTFWGFMYGGFFGNAIDTIAQTFFGYHGDPILKPLWFEPIKDPMKLLVWCLLFGLIHLFTGLGIKGCEMLHDHDYIGFISDILAWYAFLLGLIFLLLPSDMFAAILGHKLYLPAWMGPAAKWSTIGGMLVILVMSGRSNKNWAVRIALGAYDIYGVTSWLSDVLSYSRLLALGLATGVIANVVNLMASMFGGGVVGAILFIIIFILGHTLNIAINMLGAYVHTNRLQFVEFFGKFYDAGGKVFTPFKNSYKYIEIKEEK